MKTTRHTKIVATVGPASSSPEMLRRLVDHGVNTFRLNFSHGTHADHQRSFNAIRAIEAETGRAIGILQDLQGPKIRIGVVPGGPRRLIPAERITFSLVPSDDSIPLPHPEIFAAIAAGQDLLIDDGRIRLRVLRNEDGRLDTQVVAGGVLSDRKGVNLPGTRLAISPLTDKDRADLAFGLSLGVDWVALSFVQSVADVVEAKALIGTAAKLIAKIEKPQALEVIADIIAAADGIMVARGDLGVEIPPEDVPGWQKDIIAMCRRAGRPVIVATQMLESMIQAPVPTRAETSDVATAVSDGADAVMLSAETAAGQFPCECVMMMDRILRRAEAHHRVGGSNAFAPLQDLLDPNQSVAAASVVLARMAGAAAIIGFSESGVTMARLARERSVTPVFVLTPHAAVRRQSSIFWGLDCRQSQVPASYDDMVDLATRLMRDLGYGEHGTTAVLVAGTPVGQTGSTNTLRLIDVG